MIGRAGTIRQSALMSLLCVGVLLGASFAPATVGAWESGYAPENTSALAPMTTTPNGERAEDPSNAVFHGDPMLEGSPISGATASSLLAIDISSDAMLYEYNADEPVAPASTLKIITALTVLTVLEPDNSIQISANDLVDTTVYSNAQLRAGDEVSVRDLLAGLLIPSGGDAANALARVAGGRLGPQIGQSPGERFIEEMNAVAESIGMTASRFVNPDGPDHPDQHTTARDMAVAGAALLDDDLLAEIVAAPSWTMTVVGPNARQFDVLNTNALIGVDRVNGVKTGTTGQAGESIILATHREDNQIIAVIMGSENRYSDVSILLEHVDNHVRWVQFGSSPDFPNLQASAEEHQFLLVMQPFVEPMLRTDAAGLVTELELGPLPRGTLPVRWGHVVFLQGDEELFQVPVLRTGDSHDRHD